MRLKILHFMFLLALVVINCSVLFFTTSCNSNSYKTVNDEEFQELLEKSKTLVISEPDSALMILYELLPLQQGDDNALNRGWTLNIMSVAYDTKGMYDSVAYCLYEAYRLAEQAENDNLLISVYGNLGVLQFELKNAEEAINYYLKGLALAEKQQDSLKIAHQLNNLGNAYMTLSGEFEKAIPYLEQCMEISLNIKEYHPYVVSGFNLAQIYNELGECDKALQMITNITEQYGSNIYADFTLGEIYFKKNNYKAAIHEWKEILKKPMNTREFEFTILKNIAEVYKIEGSLDSAIVYLDKSYFLRDSLHNQQTIETIQNLKIAYETEKKDLQISKLEEEKQFVTWLSIAGVAMLLLVLIALFFIVLWTKQKRKKAEIKIKQLEQEKQLVATQAVLDGETQERSRLARDLHDGLGSILAAAKYNLSDIKKTPMELINIALLDKALTLLDDSMREMRRVAHHLMPESLTRYGLKQSIADFCQSIPIATFAYYGDETPLNSKLNVMVYRIIHELVSNALKHSGASHILVQIFQESDRLSLVVQDNGCGFNTEDELKGMGLANIRTRVAAYNGAILIDSKPEVGTEVSVELKVES